MRIEVSASAAAELSIAPACQARQADGIRQLDHGLARLVVVAAYEHVAFERVFFVLNMDGGDILERGNHANVLAEKLLSALRRRPVRRQLDTHDLRRYQRHRGVDEDFALERCLDRFERAFMTLERHRHDHDVRPGGGFGVDRTLYLDAEIPGQGGRAALGPVGVPGTDRHPVTGPGKSPGESGAEVSRPADNGDCRVRGRHRFSAPSWPGPTGGTLRRT